MKVKELIRILSSFPEDATVLLNREMGIDDIRPRDFAVSWAQLCWYPEYNRNGTPYTSWEYKDDSTLRQVVKTEKVLIIG